MKHKWLWIIGFVAVLIDFGMTAVLIQSPQFHESNESVVMVMDEIGELPGLLITVPIRFIALGLGILYNERYATHTFFMPLILASVSLSPVVWNTYIVTVTLLF